MEEENKNIILDDTSSNETDKSSNTDTNSDFNDVFHERDSLSESNIVDEVKNSFLQYSMSVITYFILQIF